MIIRDRRAPVGASPIFWKPFKNTRRPIAVRHLKISRVTNFRKADGNVSQNEACTPTREKGEKSKSHLAHGLHRLLEPCFLFLGLRQLLLPFIQLSLELTHQLIAIGLSDFLNQTQLIGVSLFQLPILRNESHCCFIRPSTCCVSEKREMVSLLELCPSDRLLFGVVLVHLLGQQRRPLVSLL